MAEHASEHLGRKSRDALLRRLANDGYDIQALHSKPKRDSQRRKAATKRKKTKKVAARAAQDCSLANQGANDAWLSMGVLCGSGTFAPQRLRLTQKPNAAKTSGVGVATPTAVACGGDLSLFVCADSGTVYACGRGALGIPAAAAQRRTQKPELSHAREQSASVGLFGGGTGLRAPRPIPRLTAVAKIACGSTGEHAAAVLRDGSLFTWGLGAGRASCARLGHGAGAIDGADRPRRVEALSSQRVVAVACGAEHTAVVVAKGVHEYGCDEGQGQEPKQEHELHTFGCGRAGQLGHGNSAPQHTPVRVQGLQLPCVIDANDIAATICTQDNDHDADGVRCTEVMASAPCTADITPVHSPPPLPPSSSSSSKPSAQYQASATRIAVLSLSCGMHHTAVVARDQDSHATTLWCWGWGEHGRLGNGDETMQDAPKPIVTACGDGDGAVVAGVAAGARHTLCWTANGELFGWGDNTFGQLGLSDHPEEARMDDGRALRPLRISITSPSDAIDSADNTVCSAAAGDFHSAILTRAGSLITFGWNALGQLGRSTSEDTHAPRSVHTASLTPANGSVLFGAVSLGKNHTAAIMVKHDENSSAMRLPSETLAQLAVSGGEKEAGKGPTPRQILQPKQDEAAADKQFETELAAIHAKVEAEAHAEALQRQIRRKTFAALEQLRVQEACARSQTVRRTLGAAEEQYSRSRAANAHRMAKNIALIRDSEACEIMRSNRAKEERCRKLVSVCIQEQIECVLVMDELIVRLQAASSAANAALVAATAAASATSVWRTAFATYTEIQAANAKQAPKRNRPEMTMTRSVADKRASESPKLMPSNSADRNERSRARARAAARVRAREKSLCGGLDTSGFRFRGGCSQKLSANSEAGTAKSAAVSTARSRARARRDAADVGVTRAQRIAMKGAGRKGRRVGGGFVPDVTHGDMGGSARVAERTGRRGSDGVEWMQTQLPAVSQK